MASARPRPETQENLDSIVSRLYELRAQLGPGKRLPAERILAEQWGTSRVTLRDRIRELEALGLVERRGTAGTFTRDIEPGDLVRILSIGLHATPLADPTTFKSVRIALDRQAALLAAVLQAPVPLAYAEEAVRVMESADDETALIDADAAFHRAIINASGDRGLIFFAEAVDDLVGDSLRDGASLPRVQHRDAFVRMHRRLLDAIKAGRPADVAEAIDLHYSKLDLVSETELAGGASAI